MTFSPIAMRVRNSDLISFHIVQGRKKGNGQMRAYSLLVWSIGHEGQIRSQATLPHARDCPKNQLRCAIKVLADVAEHAHLFRLFFEHVVGANGAAVHERYWGSPLLTTCWAGMPPQNY